MTGIVIIGAGETGVRAALGLREAGFAGPVTLVGDEPHDPYERPPLSKAVLLGEASAPPISGAANLVAHGVTVLTGRRALTLDRAVHGVTLSDGTTLRYDRLLLATGAKPRPLAIEGGHLALMLRRLDDALVLRQRLVQARTLVVVGGGFIGLELAAAARTRGLAVTVVEMAPRILGRAVPEAIATLVAGWHERAGVTLLTGVGLQAITAAEGRHEVHLADGRRLAAELVVAGVGAVPEVELAAEAGLAIDNGIAVDGRLCTSDPDVFAAGDCASFPHPLFGGTRLRLEAWRNAQDQGAFVARSLLGAQDTYQAVPWFWSDQYEDTLQVAGLPSQGRSVVARVPGAGALLTFHTDGEGRLVGVAGAGPLGLVAREVRLAEMMIERRLAPDPVALADAAVPLKSLLRARG